MDPKDHWERVYTSRPVDKLGWYEPHLQTSLSWILELGLPLDAPILDAGGGVSTLVDDLLDRGYRSVTVVDLSAKALSTAQERLGPRAEMVKWIEGDITSVDLPSHSYEVWHDRAAFHFLTAAEQQQRYRDNLLRALKPGGCVILGAFAPEAPPMCSGLPVLHYSPEQLQNVLGMAFELQRHDKELHVTPGGVEQMYLYCRFRRIT